MPVNAGVGLRMAPTHLSLLSKRLQLLLKTKLLPLATTQLRSVVCYEPVLVTDPISNQDIWKLFHHSSGSSIHEIKSSPIVWFLEFIFA